MHIVIYPSFDWDPVFVLKLVVFRHVVNDYDSSKIRTNFGKIFHVHSPSVGAVFSVQSPADQAFFVEVVQQEVGILSQPSSEYDQFVVL